MGYTINVSEVRYVLLTNNHWLFKKLWDYSSICSVADFLYNNYYFNHLFTYTPVKFLKQNRKNDTTTDVYF